MTLIWLLAALCVGLMGFAIQRGGTCTVAAVDELLNRRRAARMLAMLEASLWVCGGLAIAQWFGRADSVPNGFAIDRWVLAGGAMLGFGAWLNRACVFGAIARLGSGEWAYAATPLGFYAGCASAPWLFARPAPVVGASSAWSTMASIAAPAFIAYALWRTLPAAWALRGAGRTIALRAKVWAPHAATVVIGIAFVITLLLVGRWAYTDVLADLARGMADRIAGRNLLLVALLAGTTLGGWSAGRWSHVPPTASQVARCFAGGVIMGWGSLLIPGSNDGLILIGLPSLHAHAWAAFAMMCATIAAAMSLQRALTPNGRSRPMA